MIGISRRVSSLATAFVCGLLLVLASGVEAGGIPAMDELHTYSANVPGSERAVLVPGRGFVVIYDLAAQRTVAWLPHDGSVTAVAVSSDGTRLGVGTHVGYEPVSGYLGAWRLPDGVYHGAVSTPGSDAIAFLGEDLAYDQFSSLHLWRMAEQSVGDARAASPPEIYHYKSQVISLKGRDGELLVGLHDGSAHMITQTGEPIVLSTGRGDVVDVAISPDGAFAATGNVNGELRVWQPADASLHLWKTVRDGTVTSLEFDPTGTLLAFATDAEEVGLLRAVDGRVLWTHRSKDAHTASGDRMSGYASVRFTAGGRRLIAAGVDNRLELFEIDHEGRGSSLGPLEPRTFVTAVAFSPEGERATGYSSGAVTLGRPGVDQEARQIYTGSSPIMGLAFGEERELLVGELSGRGATLRGRGYSREAQTHEFDTIRSVAWIGEAAAVAGGVSLESPNGGAAAFRGAEEWYGHRSMAGAVTSTLALADVLVTGSLDGTLRLFRPFAEEAPVATADAGSAINGLLLDGDGRILTLTDGSGISRYRWDGNALSPSGRLRAVREPLKVGAIDNRRNRLALADFQGHLWVFDYATMALERAADYGSQVTAAAFEPQTGDLHLFLADGDAHVVSF